MNSRLFEKYKNIILTKHFVNLESWEKALDIWTKKFGHTDKNLADFIWAMFNEILTVIGGSFKDEEDLYIRQRDVYFSMWEYLKDENRDATHQRRGGRLRGQWLGSGERGESFRYCGLLAQRQRRSSDHGLLQSAALCRGENAQPVRANPRRSRGGFLRHQ